MNKVRQAVTALDRDPARWFLLDGIGAALSALLAGAVLVHFEEFLGMPSSTLFKLALAACLLVAYDVLHLLRKREGSRFLRNGLRRLSLLNAAYLILSLAFAFQHRHTLTVAGWGYILLEGAVVGCLSVLEFRAGSEHECRKRRQRDESTAY